MATNHRNLKVTLEVRLFLAARFLAIPELVGFLISRPSIPSLPCINLPSKKKSYLPSYLHREGYREVLGAAEEMKEDKSDGISFFQ